MMSSNIIMTHQCMTPWSGVKVTQTYEAMFVCVRLYVYRYIRSILESLRLQVESPVLETSIVSPSCLSCWLQACKHQLILQRGLKTPIRSLLRVVSPHISDGGNGIWHLGEKVSWQCWKNDHVTSKKKN